MAAFFASVDNPVEVPLTVALQRVEVGPEGADIVYINADVDIFLVVSPILDTGAAVPATARYRIPAGVAHPLRLTRARILLSAVTGTGTAWVCPMAKAPVDLRRTEDPCL